MKDYWAKFLPEFGRSILVDSQEHNLSRLRKLEDDRMKLIKEIQQYEREIIDSFSDTWSDLEISNAKANAKEFGTVNAMHEELSQRYK